MTNQDSNAPTKQRSFTTRFAAGTVASFLRLVGKTGTLTVKPSDFPVVASKNRPAIFAFWHGQFMLTPLVRPDIPTGVLVARHDDAEILGAMLEHFGLTLIRGAGAGARKRDRGGATALRISLKTLKAGTSIAMTADIPPGPARKLGEGIIAIARMSGRPIIPTAAASSRFYVFNTWSRLTLNLPFSRKALVTGDPISVPRNATPDELEALRLHVETELNRLTHEAYAIVGQAQHPRAPLTGRPTPPGLVAKLYRTGTRVMEFAGPAILNRRTARGKEDKTRQNERLGHPERPRPQGRLAWFHAASVGELNAIRPLLTEIKKRHPDVNLLITTGTVTSAKIAGEQLGDIAIHQFIPLDGPRMVRRFLDHWRPDVALFVESEIWPNLIYETSQKQITLILLNARMSAKTTKAWRKPFRTRTAASLFSRFDHILAQSAIDLLRYTRLGAANVELTGNLKIDAAPIAVDPDALALLRDAIGDRPVFLATSTHPGEDVQIADAHDIITRSHAGLLTIIIPRHPERGESIAEIVAECDLDSAQRSLGEPITSETEIYIADTIGETGLFFSLAGVTFMGGSLVPHGGQNPIEPIRLGSPVLTGPHTHNFEDIYANLKTHGAVVEITTAKQLATEAIAILSDQNHREKMQKGADTVFQELSGAFARTLECIDPYLSGKASQKRTESDAS